MSPYSKPLEQWNLHYIPMTPMYIFSADGFSNGSFAFFSKTELRDVIDDKKKLLAFLKPYHEYLDACNVKYQYKPLN